MHGEGRGEVLDLMPAREAGGDEGGAGVGAYGGEEAAFADLAGDVVVVLTIAEGSGHAAAARFGVNNSSLRDAGEERFDGGKQSHRFLMAVAVEEDGGWGGGEREVGAAGFEFR